MHTKKTITNFLSVLIFFTIFISNVSQAMGLSHSILKYDIEKTQNNSQKNNNTEDIKNDLNNFINKTTFFYKNQTSYNFIELQYNYISVENKLTEKNINLKLAIALITVEKKYDWPIIQEIIDTPVGKFITQIKNNGSDYQDILNNIPEKEILQLDIWWLQFFMTGDHEFLEYIFTASSDTDIKKYIRTASAKWSLESNATQHEYVKEFLKNKQSLL